MISARPFSLSSLALMSMNKRRRSGSSAATISDESDECATPDRDVTPEMESTMMTGSATITEDKEAQEEQQDLANNVSTTTTVLLSSGRKKKKLDPVRVSYIILWVA